MGRFWTSLENARFFSNLAKKQTQNTWQLKITQILLQQWVTSLDSQVRLPSYLTA